MKKFFARFGKHGVKKHHGSAYYMAMLFTIVIELALGMNAGFLIYQNFHVTVYSLIASEGWANATTLLLAAAFAAGVFFGGMWTFSGFIDNLEDAKAYIQEFRSRGWPVHLIWSGLLLVMTLDLTTLLFRYAYFDEKGAHALFAFSCVLIVLPPVLGPLIHVLEHTPHTRQLAKVRTQVEQRHTGNLSRIADEIDDDLLDDLLSDDEQVSASAVNEYYRRKETRDNEQRVSQIEEEQDVRDGQAKKNLPLKLASRRKQA